MLRAAALSEVHPPSPEAESVRDLYRCRDDVSFEHATARAAFDDVFLDSKAEQTFDASS